MWTPPSCIIYALCTTECHGLRPVDNNELIFLFKLVWSSTGISNLERKEEKESIYRKKGLLSMGDVVALVLSLFACMVAFVDISH